MMWIEDRTDGVVIAVRAIPGASIAGVKGVRGDEMVIGVHSAAEGGKANKELVKLVAGMLRVPKSAVSVLTGEKSRSKRLHVAGVSAGDATERLG